MKPPSSPLPPADLATALPVKRPPTWQQLTMTLALALVSMHATPGMAAETTPSPLPRITLHVPDELQSLLQRYLELPAAPAREDEHARAAILSQIRDDVAELLATEGYYTPGLRWEGEALRLTPGKRTTVSQVSIAFSGAIAAAAPDGLDGSGMKLLQRRERLLQTWPLKAGAAFRSEDWQDAKTTLLAEVANQDFAAARIVDSRAEVDPAKAQVSLNISIDSGPAYHFGPLRITGLQRYSAALVERLLPFDRGAPYNRDKLLSLQSRLQNTPWFQSVTVEPLLETASSGELPILVSVRELPAKSVAFGLGYGTNTGARGEVNFQHHDLFHRAWDFKSGVRHEQKRQTLYADLSLLPSPSGYRQNFGSQLEYSDIEGLKTERILLSTRRSRTLGQIETRLGLEWQREIQRPQDAVSEIDRALLLDWHWLKRAVDDKLDPRAGYVLELRIGGASRRLLSSRDFLRSQLRYQQWWSLSPRDIISLRGELGLTAAASSDGIPQDYLFRAGGSQSVRGYAYHSLGVREGSAIVGGRALNTASIEYIHWLRGSSWGMAGFVDAGDAADNWQELKPMLGYGLGARWKSPAGPLALDLARGQQGNGWRLHFALSMAF